MHDLREVHWEAPYRALRYPKYTLGKGVLLKKNEGLWPEAYMDVDWAGYK